MSLGARVHFSRAAVSEFFSGGKYQLGLALTETVKLFRFRAGPRELNMISVLRRWHPITAIPFGCLLTRRREPTISPSSRAFPSHRSVGCRRPQLSTFCYDLGTAQ